MNKRFRTKLLKEKKKKRCRYCKSEENLTYDHKIPIIQGGKDEYKNIQVLCFSCNGMKSGLTHKQVKNLFKWFLRIQAGRIEAGKKPYTLR